jgi:hypothetical protein
MTKELLLFQKHEGDIAVEVRGIDGHRCIELLRRYKHDGEWRVTNHLGYGNQHQYTLLLKAAKDWLNTQDK